jgi:hypothetical protein
MIGQRFNFEDVFFRDLTLCVLDTLEGEINWVNKFTNGDMELFKTYTPPTSNPI